MLLHFTRESGRLDRVAGPFELGQEPVQPAPLVDQFVGAGPGAELLAVVGVDSQPIAPAGERITQEADHLLRIGKRDSVAQAHERREEPETTPRAFGEKRAPDALATHAHLMELGIVNRQVAHAGIDQIERQVGLPHSLGEPHAPRIGAQFPCQERSHALDLAPAVLRRQRRQHRLEESAAQQFKPVFGDRRANAIEVLRMSLEEPLPQASRVVQDPAYTGMRFHHIQERQVGSLIGILDDVIEVADGLVIVDAEDETYGRHSVLLQAKRLSDRDRG